MDTHNEPEPVHHPTGTALYYPYIHVRKLDHLKAALLYWDRVRRIVPSSVRNGKYANDDAEEVRLLVDHDLLVATDPQPYEERAARKFFEHIEPHSERFRIDLDAARDLSRRNRGIHIEKLGGAVVWRLEQLGLAHQMGEWVSMHDKVGALYMFCLASEMGERMAAALLSDSADDASIGQSMLFEPSASTPLSEVLVQIGVALPSPADLKQVSTHAIADFAEKRAAERQRFRKAVEGIVQSARSIGDPNAVVDHLQSQRTEISQAVKDLRATLDELHVGAVSGWAKITVPTGAAVAIAALPLSAVAAAILAATGLAVAAIAVFAETRGKLRQARTSSPYHYLVSVERELGIDPRAG